MAGCFFFCQAEDGIRDRNVTGVQTCALPISIPTTVPEDTMEAVVDFFGKYDVASFGIGSFGPIDVNPASETYGYITSTRSEEHTSELQSRFDLVCRLLLEKKNIKRCEMS